MNEDINQYPIYVLVYDGKLMAASWIKSTADYNHQTHQLHHYIPKSIYKRDKAWFNERGIAQKLILLPNFLHEQVHNQAISNLPDDEFQKKFRISRWELVFNRKHTKY